MSKTETLKKQLIEISQAVNAFNSDAVQVIVAERILGHLMRPGDSIDPEGQTPGDMNHSGQDQAPIKSKQQAKQPGATKLLHGLVISDFFNNPRSIGDVTDYFNDNYTGPFYTNQISGLLLGLFKNGKLQRQVDPETKRYVYLNA